MTETMTIRSFDERDQDAVIALWQACGLLRSWNDPAKDIVRKLAVGRDLFLVGEQDHQIIASAMGGYDGHRGWVNYLAVSPDQQRKGHARKIMAELEARLKKRGCPKLNLQLRTDNTAALGFYEALGYPQDAAISLGKRLISDD